MSIALEMRVKELIARVNTLEERIVVLETTKTATNTLHVPKKDDKWKNANSRPS